MIDGANGSRNVGGMSTQIHGSGVNVNDEDEQGVRHM